MSPNRKLRDDFVEKSSAQHPCQFAGRVKKREVWQTVDGSQFYDMSSASEYEQSLFEEWLRTEPKLDVVKFLTLMNAISEHDDEYYSTPHGLSLAFIRRFWEFHQCWRGVDSAARARLLSRHSGFSSPLTREEDTSPSVT